MPELVRRLPNRAILSSAVLVFIGFLYCYYTVFIELVRQWDNNNTYSFGYIVPLVSLYLVWEKRAILSRLVISPAPIPGFLFLGFSMALFLSGKFGGMIILQELSIITALPAITLIVLGREVTKALAFPLSYLFFMLPAWDYPINWLQYPFQMVSARIGGGLLPLVGVPAHQHGIIIEIPNLTIEVARACSGVNFLISILAIGIPVAALYFDSLWKRILLLLVSVFIAILGNGLRAALIALFAYKGLSGNLHGPGHIFYGYFVSVLGMVVLFTGVYLFGKPVASGVIGEIDRDGGPDALPDRSERRWTWVIAATFLFLAAGFIASYHSFRPSHLKNDLQGFPRSIGDYTAADQPPVLEDLSGNGADAELSRAYSDGRGRLYQLYVGYYSYQEQKKKVTNYRMRELFRNAKEYPFPAGLPTIENINGFMTEIKDEKRLVLFWYDVDGKTVTKSYNVILDTAIRGMFRNRSNAAIVVVTTGYDPGSDIPSQIEGHSGFVKEIAIRLDEYLDAP